MKKTKIYCFDLDETLCTKALDGDYFTAKPMLKAITKVNELFDLGNTILIFTGRGSSSGKNWEELTVKQLNQWGLKHHKLIMNKKPTYDIVIDDKAINALEWRKTNCGTRGVVAGAFDLIHPGYCRLFKFCKEHCDHLTVLLHEDPSFERKKLIPVHTVEERKEILFSIKYIDDVVVYKTEKELENNIKDKKYDIRFLGDDYKNKQITGQTIPIEILYTNRSHGYSTTDLKKKVYNSYKEYFK